MDEIINPEAEEIQKVKIEAMLEELRRAFISDLAGRVDQIESLTIELEKERTFIDTFTELFRIVHSLKGNGGCYGFNVITHVCHHLESQLNKCDGSYKNITTNLIDACLQDIDFLKRVDSALNANQSLDPIADEFRAVANQQEEAKLNCLFVDKSTSVIALYKKAFSELSLNYTHAQDGIAAMNLMQFNHYDVLVSSYEVGYINGIALITAAKMSHPTSQMTTILVSSSESMAKTSDPAIQPDHVFVKGRSTVGDIKTVLVAKSAETGAK